MAFYGLSLRIFKQMDPAYQTLASALRKRLTLIADREAYLHDPSAHFQSLKSVSEEIVLLGASLPYPRDPQLEHFLKSCSYEKALKLLDSMGTNTKQA
jgi:hypothetical protein